MNAQARGELTSSLFSEVLHSSGTLQLRATGASMLPTLWPGDLLTIQSREFDEVRVGALVFFSRRGRFFIHRVVRKSVLNGEPVLITRGDCMAEDDPPVCPAELLGTVSMVDHDGVSFTPAPRLRLPRRVLARLLCHSDLFRRAALRLHTRQRVASSGGNLAPRKAAL
ncbi:MAG TPA: S24/S26 family peptidase [Terriglobales bacterium]|jgi:hypothetical protein|nr:S24/S26 family peptidase [Terriglobales bacterium]